MNTKQHTIDAKGKRLGRVASQAAHLLMEKDVPGFEKYRKLGNTVTVMNASKILMTEKRVSEIRYSRASGYQGNLVQENIKTLRARRGMGEVVRRAVKGMLPNNKLRPAMLKRLVVEE